MVQFFNFDSVSCKNATMQHYKDRKYDVLFIRANHKYMKIFSFCIFEKSDHLLVYLMLKKLESHSPNAGLMANTV